MIHQDIEPFVTRGWTADLVPVRHGRKNPLYAEWQHHDWTDEQIERSADVFPQRINVGLRCERLVVLDFDLVSDTDEDVIDAVARLAGKKGLPPARQRRSGCSWRQKLVWLLDPFDDTPDPPPAVVWGGDKAEVLTGRGRQFVASGRHPAGDDYIWDGGGIPRPEDLAPIGFAVLGELLDALERGLAKRGREVTRRRSHEAEGGEASAIGDPDLMAPDVATAAAALRAIPNVDLGWDDYVALAHAYKAAVGGQEEGFPAFDDWASQHPGYDPDNRDVSPRGRWDGIKASRIGWDWLESVAMAAGWRPAEGIFPPLEVPPEAAGAAPVDEDLRALEIEEAQAIQHGGALGDLALALGFTLHVRNRLAWVPEMPGGMLAYNGRQWLPDQGQFAMAVQRHLLSVQTTVADDVKAKRDLTSARRVSAVSALARPRLWVPLEAFDAHPLWLNTPEGVLDIETGEIRTGRASDRMRQITAVAAGASVPAEWSTFLETVFAGNEDVIRYMQIVAGLTLIGEVRENALFFAFGHGGNGKSTFLGALMDALGTGKTGYAMSLPVEVLMLAQSQGHPALIAQLYGKRMAVASEIPARARWNDARVKELTGSDAINAHFMRADPFSFVPSHTLWIHGNNRPDFGAADDAWQRRIHLIPFDVPLAASGKADPKIGRSLRQPGTLAGVLRWMIEGARMYLREGLERPAAVVEAGREYVAEMDPVAAWVSERCLVGLEHRDTAQGLFDDMRSWAERMSENSDDGFAAALAMPPDAARLAKVLHGMGYRSAKSNNQRFIAGIRRRLVVVAEEGR